MRALTVLPKQPGTARLDRLSHVPGDAAGLALDTLCVGVCGTDREILRGDYGWAPPGEDRLVLGHECIARVAESGHGFKPGELAVPIVRRPDPVPCSACAAGEWDMCRNGRYTEHGIKQLDGFCAERIRVRAEFLVRVPPSLGALAVLVEPASVVAKAWEHIERIGRRAHWTPRRRAVRFARPSPIAWRSSRYESLPYASEETIFRCWSTIFSDACHFILAIICGASAAA